MDSSQSALQFLLSQPQHEVHKLLDLWKALHVENTVSKPIVSKETMSEVDLVVPRNQVDVPTYDQIFKPPPIRHRGENKLYGKAYLRKYYPDQLRILNGNYAIVRKWFEKSDSFRDIRKNPEEKEKMMAFIMENRKKEGTIKNIKVTGANYVWLDEDIYTWVIKSLQAKQKHARKKNNASTLVRLQFLINIVY